MNVFVLGHHQELRLSHMFSYQLQNSKTSTSASLSIFVYFASIFFSCCLNLCVLLSGLCAVFIPVATLLVKMMDGSVVY